MDGLGTSNDDGAAQCRHLGSIISVASGAVEFRKTLEPSWVTLVDALLAHRRNLAVRVSHEMRSALKVFRSIPQDVLYLEVRFEVERALRSIRSEQAVAADQHFDEFAVIGEIGKAQSVAVDDLIRAWRIGVEVLVDAARERARDLDVRHVEVMEFIQRLMVWSDEAVWW